MRHRILVLPAAGLMAASFTANAQTETLDYQGSLLSSGETISGSVVLGVPLGADVANATVIPANFQFPTLFIDSPAPGYYGRKCHYYRGNTAPPCGCGWIGTGP